MKTKAVLAKVVLKATNLAIQTSALTASGESSAKTGTLSSNLPGNKSVLMLVVFALATHILALVIVVSFAVSVSVVTFLAEPLKHSNPVILCEALS